eukprot:1148543-Rhodomonas_salina.1
MEVLSTNAVKTAADAITGNVEAVTDTHLKCEYQTFKRDSFIVLQSHLQKYHDAAGEPTPPNPPPSPSHPPFLHTTFHPSSFSSAAPLKRQNSFSLESQALFNSSFFLTLALVQAADATAFEEIGAYDSA